MTDHTPQDQTAELYRQHTRRAAMRFRTFLIAELERLPAWHGMHDEYGEQLEDLERRLFAPRSIAEAA